MGVKSTYNIAACSPSRLEVGSYESNAMGMPGIAYTVPGLIDSVRHGETAILVKENSPHELATSAICLLSDQDLLTKDTNNALTFSKLQLG
jgi:glycosyltransferase involved in cell wall biosynthesis